MSSTTEQARRRAGAAAAGPRLPCSHREARCHDEPVIQAEVRRLARALRPDGVLHRDALERAAGAPHWHEGAFASALAAAVRAGVIERVPAASDRIKPGWSPAARRRPGAAHQPRR
jgi:hypothetical protein